MGYRIKCPYWVSLLSVSNRDLRAPGGTCSPKLDSWLKKKILCREFSKLQVSSFSELTPTVVSTSCSWLECNRLQPSAVHQPCGLVCSAFRDAFLLIVVVKSGYFHHSITRMFTEAELLFVECFLFFHTSLWSHFFTFNACCEQWLKLLRQMVDWLFAWLSKGTGFSIKQAGEQILWAANCNS